MNTNTYDFFNSILLSSESDQKQNEYIKLKIYEWKNIKVGASIHINIDGKCLTIKCIKKIGHINVFMSIYDNKPIFLQEDFTCIKNIKNNEIENIYSIEKENKFGPKTTHVILRRLVIKQTKYFTCNKYLRAIEENSEYISSSLYDDNTLIRIVPFNWILPLFFSIFNKTPVKLHIDQHKQHVKQQKVLTPVKKHIEQKIVEKHIEQKKDDIYHKDILIEGMIRITSSVIQQNDNEGKLIIDYLLSQILLCTDIF
jgi:hypothetical protein